MAETRTSRLAPVSSQRYGIFLGLAPSQFTLLTCAVTVSCPPISSGKATAYTSTQFAKTGCSGMFAVSPWRPTQSNGESNDVAIRAPQRGTTRGCAALLASVNVALHEDFPT